jgi:hypothetical protein
MDFFEQAMGGGMSRGPGKDVQVGTHSRGCVMIRTLGKCVVRDIGTFALNFALLRFALSA